MKTRSEEAAAQYRRSAEISAPGDRSAIDDLMRAAHIEFRIGNKAQAVSDLEAAGERAIAVGLRFAAANALTHAGWVAADAGDTLRARHLLERARRAASAPAPRAPSVYELLT